MLCIIFIISFLIKLRIGFSGDPSKNMVNQIELIPLSFFLVISTLDMTDLDKIIVLQGLSLTIIGILFYVSSIPSEWNE
jgi:hypothetical protein